MTHADAWEFRIVIACFFRADKGEIFVILPAFICQIFNLKLCIVLIIFLFLGWLF